METEKGDYVSNCRELNRAGSRGGGGLTQQSTDNVPGCGTLCVILVVESLLYALIQTYNVLAGFMSV